MSDSEEGRPHPRRRQGAARRRRSAGADDLLRAYGAAGPIPPAPLPPPAAPCCSLDWREAARAALGRPDTPPRRVPTAEAAQQLVPVRERTLTLLEHLRAAYGWRVSPAARRWFDYVHHELGHAATIAQTRRLIREVCGGVVAPTPRPLPADVQAWAVAIHRDLMQYDRRHGFGAAEGQR